MNNEKIILAKSLLEWSLGSKTEWLKSSEEDILELADIAKRKGIVLPSPDFAVFKTYYAQIGVPNKNRVLLKREDVEKGLPTLIGKNINLDHFGKDSICGYILDAKIDGDMIVVYGCIFKSLFNDKFEEIQKKFENGELAVSFEIWNIDPSTGKSVVVFTEEGIKIISPIIFHGCGLLLTKPPACPKAKVTALLASEELLETEKIVNEIFQKDERLVYAEEALECLHCKNCEKECEQMEEPKVVIESIDPNLFIKEDGSLDEDKLSTSFSKEAIDKVKELIKEGKQPLEAIKQILEENKEKLQEDNKKEFPKTDEEKAKDYFGISDEDWSKLSDEEKNNYIAKLPPEGTELQKEIEPEKLSWTCPMCDLTVSPLVANMKYCPFCGCLVEEKENVEIEKDDEDEVTEEAKKLSYEEKQELPDSDFAVVVNVKNKKTGEPRKIRMFPIPDEEHVRNALARLGQPAPRETLKRLGVSIESVKNKILKRAKKLGMTQLLERYKESSYLEDEAILSLSNVINELKNEISNISNEKDNVLKEKDKEIATLKAELEQKTQEIKKLTDVEVKPDLCVGSVEDIKTEIKKHQEKIDELAFGKKKEKKR